MPPFPEMRPKKSPPRRTAFRLAAVRLGLLVALRLDVEQCGLVWANGDKAARHAPFLEYGRKIAPSLRCV